MTSAIFENARLKLLRSKTHIADLEEKLAAYLAAKPYNISVLPDNRTSPPGNILWLDLNTVLPSEIRMIFGDTIHNLRSALDTLVYDITVPLGAKPKKVEFPFRTNKRDLEDALQKGEVRFAPQAIKDFILTDVKPFSQPVGQGDHTLWCLHKLDIIDKHRLVVGVTGIVGIKGSYKISGATFSEVSLGVSMHGSGVIAQSSQTISIESELIPVLDVRIGEKDYLFDKSMIETLNILHSKVANVISGFTTRCNLKP